MTQLGWIGIGAMGGQMLPHLLRAGHGVTVFARDPRASAPLLEAGAVAVSSPADVAATAEVVVTILGGPNDVSAVYRGSNGLLSAARPSTVLIDMTTSSPALARALADEGDALGLELLDAPVSGGPSRAAIATLTIMVGGRETAFAKVRPLLSLVGTTVVYMGSSGAGQIAKLANQAAVGAGMLGLCEAFLLATANGLDGRDLERVLGTGIVGSDLARFALSRMSVGDDEPGFRIAHMIKDLELARSEGEAASLQLPGVSLVLGLYRELAAAGLADKGTQVLAKALESGKRSAMGSMRAHQGGRES